ncbi:MAG: 4Fe-4S dicluster domain-containing protein [Candidatus Thorarchaeota archaeon]
MSTQVYELNDESQAFRNEVVEEEGGHHLKSCFQCSSCSLACPVAEVGVDLHPRRVIRQILFGLRKEVLQSPEIWKCVGCFECTDMCPQNVRFTEVIEALRRIAIRDSKHDNKNHRITLPKEAVLKHSFDKRFKESVWLWGRTWEPGMIGRYFLYGRGFPFGALIGFKYLSMILNLLAKFKIEFLPPRTGETRKEVRRIFARAKEIQNGKGSSS